jgi:hypothetical protein
VSTTLAANFGFNFVDTVDQLVTSIVDTGDILVTCVTGTNNKSIDGFL